MRSKLKIVFDSANKEYILLVPNQFTFVFDSDFKKIKIITAEGTKEYKCNLRAIYCTFNICGHFHFVQSMRFATELLLISNVSYHNDNFQCIYIHPSYLLQIMKFLIQYTSPRLIPNGGKIINIKIYPDHINVFYQNGHHRTYNSNVISLSGLKGWYLARKRFSNKNFFEFDTTEYDRKTKFFDIHQLYLLDDDKKFSLELSSDKKQLIFIHEDNMKKIVIDRVKFQVDRFIINDTIVCQNGWTSCLYDKNIRLSRYFFEQLINAFLQF